MQEVPRRKALWLEVGALSAWMLLPSLVAFKVFRPWDAWYDTVNPWINVNSALMNLGTALLFVFVMWASGDRWKTFGLRRPLWKVDVLLTVFLIALALCLYYFPYRLNPTTEIAEMRKLFPMPEGPVIGASIFFAASMGVLVEEMYFRGYLISRLEELTGNVWIGVVASAFAFGFVHLYQGLIGAVLALGLGLAFGIAYVGRPCIWPMTIAHFVCNVTLTYMI